MDIAVHGINGKMGQAIAETILESSDCPLSAASVRGNHPWAGKPLSAVSALATDLKCTSNLEFLCQHSDVVIDFTRPEATLALLPICQRFNRPVMIGTTGFHDEAKVWINQAAKEIPIVLAANTSLGVNVLREACRLAARALSPEDWDVEIFEIHHRRKVDAPSGTALLLGEAIAEAQQTDFEKRKTYPHNKQRAPQEIGFSSARGGEIAGEHTVYFINDHERLEFTHRAQDRSIFARGAVRAAQWLAKQPAGLYDMSDVLGFTHAK